MCLYVYHIYIYMSTCTFTNIIYEVRERDEGKDMVSKRPSILVLIGQNMQDMQDQVGNTKIRSL